MNKKEYLTALGKALSALPRKDRAKTLDFYNELIADRLEEGLPESEILEALGAPEAVAAQILSELPEKPRKKTSPLTVVLLVLGFPLWFSLLLTAAVLLLTVLIVLFAAELVFAVCGVAGVLGSVVILLLRKPLAALALLAIGLVCLGLAIPLWFFCLSAAKAIRKLTKKLCRSMFRRR